MRKLFLYALLCVAGVMVMGCGTKSTTSQEPLQTTLKSNVFTLVTVNKTAVPAGNPMTLEFNEDMRIAAKVCNRFMGQAEEVNGVITVKQMGGTLMACPTQELDKIERIFKRMLSSGVNAQIINNTLVLTQGGDELVYAMVRK